MYKKYIVNYLIKTANATEYGDNKWLDSRLRKIDESTKYNIPINLTAGAGSGLLGSYALLGLGKLHPILALPLGAGIGYGGYKLSERLNNRYDSIAKDNAYAINSKYRAKHPVKSVWK